jgi:hypothetical protein
VTTLRGRRRKLGEMTRTDGEEQEFKLCGFRFDCWMERWRLATTVMRVSCGVTFLQLNRFGREEKRSLLTTTLTTPDGETVLTDKFQIYQTIAKSAVVCEGAVFFFFYFFFFLFSFSK